MSLFGDMTSRPEAISPWLALAISLVYGMGADGEIDEEEVGFLLTALGGERIDDRTVGVGRDGRDLLDRAIAYVERHEPAEFLAVAAPGLTREQKLCILLSMADCALSDGVAEREEQELIVEFQMAFGLTDEELRPLFQALLIKNDKSVF